MLNNVILVGRLVDEPRLAKVNDQISVANIVLAVERPFRSGDNVFDTDFIPVSVWRGYADAVASYCHKGSIIGVKGRIQNKPIIIDDKNYQTLELIAERVSFISLKSPVADGKMPEAEKQSKEDTKQKNEPKTKTKSKEKE